MAERDDLDRFIARRQEQNPQFASMVDAAEERRRRLRALAADRKAAGLSQTVVASRMGTSQSTVARVESGSDDVRLSTLEKYAAAIGKTLNWGLVADDRLLGSR